jgi:hypothetical protein
MSLDMSGEILALANASITVTRPSISFDSHGRRTDGAAATVATALPVVIQPATGRDFQRLPEGTRERVSWAVWATVELKNGDRFTYGGEIHEIGHVDPWTAGNYWKAISLRVGG